jgi:hypothetical protein
MRESGNPPFDDIPGQAWDANKTETANLRPDTKNRDFGGPRSFEELNQ